MAEDQVRGVGLLISKSWKDFLHLQKGYGVALLASIFEA